MQIQGMYSVCYIWVLFSAANDAFRKSWVQVVLWSGNLSVVFSSPLWADFTEGWAGKERRKT
jgi:hypothetical protein